HRTWVPTIPYLSGHFRVVAPDLPGYGQSRVVASDGVPDGLIRLVGGLMTALQMVPCVVAGASFGGALALGLAVRHPERVRALVAIGAPGVQIWPGTLQMRLARTTRNVPGLLALALQVMPRMQARWLVRGVLGPSPAAAELSAQAEAT